MAAMENEMQALLDARAAALVRGDAAFFREFLADEFVYTNAGGTVFDKAGYIEFFLVSGDMRWRSQEIDDFRVRGHGDVAIVTCRLRDRAEFRGQAIDGRFRSTLVFRRRGDAWLCLAGHATEEPCAT